MNAFKIEVEKKDVVSRAVKITRLWNFFNFRNCIN